MKIPKVLLFNWFGDNIPDFCKYSIDMFHTINPDYEIKVTFLTIQQLEDLYNCKNLSNLDTYELFIRNAIIDSIDILSKEYLRPFLSGFNDCLRIKQLDTYGGIYLDCDMFPIRPFDDELLSLGWFCMCRQFPNQNHITLENGFCGKNKDYMGDKTILSIIYEDQKKTKILQDKFYNCKLKYGEYYGDPKYNYVDHYSKYSWNPKKCIVKKTLMDDIIFQKTHRKINFVC